MSQSNEPLTGEKLDAYRAWFDRWWRQDFSWDRWHEDQQDWVRTSRHDWLYGQYGGPVFAGELKGGEPHLFEFAHRGQRRRFTRYHYPLYDYEGQPTVKAGGNNIYGFAPELISFLQDAEEQAERLLDLLAAHAMESSEYDEIIERWKQGHEGALSWSFYWHIDENAAHLNGICLSAVFLPSRRFAVTGETAGLHLRVSHNHAFFGDTLDYTGCIIGGHAMFRTALLDKDVFFKSTQFRGYVVFSEAQFSGDAWFRDAQYGTYTEFGDAKFFENAWFSNTTFDGYAWFDNVQFCGGAFFSCTQFAGNAWFSGSDQSNGNSIDLQSVDFENAVFLEDVSFENRYFRRKTSFKNAWFFGCAEFHNCSLHKDTAFTLSNFSLPPEGPSWRGAANPLISRCRESLSVERREAFDKALEKHPAMTATQARAAQIMDLSSEGSADNLSHRYERAFRTLKDHMEKARSRNEEQGFHALELQSRTSVVTRDDVKIWERLAASVYGAASNYGSSIIRPLQCLVLIFAVMTVVYRFLLSSLDKWGWGEALSFSMQVTLPISLGVYPLRKASSDPIAEILEALSPLQLAGLTGVVSIHAFVCIILWFLFALALRRRFQIN